MFFNIQIDLIILKTYDQQFTAKKSLRIIFKVILAQASGFGLGLNIAGTCYN